MANMIDHPMDEAHGFWRLVGFLLVLWVVLNRFIPDLFVLPVGMSVRPSQAILGLALISLVFALITSPQSWPRGVPAASAVALMLVVAFTPFWRSLDFTSYQAEGAERGLMLFALYATLFLAAYWIAGMHGWGLRLLRVIVAMTSWQALLALYEWRAGQDVVVFWPVWPLMGLATDTVQRAANFRIDGLFRASSTAPHPIVMSALMAVAIVLVLVLFIDEPESRKRRWLLASLVPMAAGMMVVNARTGFVVLLVGGIAVVASQVRRLPRFIPLALVAMMVFGIGTILSPSAARSTLNMFWNAREDNSVNERVDRLDELPDLIAEQPLIADGWLTNDPKVNLFDNTYSLTLLELGVIGTAILLIFVISCLVRMISMRRHLAASEISLVFAGIVGGFALLSAGFTFDALAFDQFLPTCILLLGIGLGAADRAARRIRTADQALLELRHQPVG